MTVASLGLGSNLGNREENLATALRHLTDSGEVTILALSDFIETDPVGGPSQPGYLNGAAQIETDLSPTELLALLQQAEVKAGRRPTGVRWGPREADLDLLLFGDLTLESDDLTIPHPRLRDREFVLAPLATIAPEAVDPVTGDTVAILLEKLRRDRSGAPVARLAGSLEELSAYIEMAKGNRFSLGLVPTMGGFHEGHLSLMRAARARCDKVIVSLFVNPLQFGPEEDLDRYPRQMRRDLRMAAENGVDLVFAPAAEEMVPRGFATEVAVKSLSERYCGASRPGHFEGVATIVTRLFNLVRPDVAWFGRKDYQQTVVIRRMVKDLAMPVEVVIHPTVREEDGLALSSRNAYLSEDERRRAPALFRGLVRANDAYQEGERDTDALEALVKREAVAAEYALEYVTVAHPDTLAPIPTVGEAGGVILVAGRLGTTRLIDNLVLGEEL